MHSIAVPCTLCAFGAPTSTPLAAAVRRFAVLPAAVALLLAFGAAGLRAAAPQVQGSAGCPALPQARAALDGVARELQTQGLALQASCPGAGGAGWVVQVRVVDGMKASKIVRGPLADGEGVDMGTPAGVAEAGARVGAQGYSPDVLFNRRWLLGVMERHRFTNLPDAWWHFASGAASSEASRADITAR